MAHSVTDDALLLVFERVVGPEIERWPDATFEPTRAMAPFVLAAVCTRWRILLRSTPTLWAYFGFPHDPKKFALQSSRLQVLMELSKDTAIDVVLEPGYHYDVAVKCHRILETIASTAKRWRNARIELSDRFVTQPLQLALQIPEAPNLISLSLRIDGIPLYLPMAPRLERLHVYWPYSWEIDFVLAGDLEALTIRMPNLRAMSVISSDDGELPINLYGQLADQLTYLCIMVNLHDMPSPPPHVIQCPQVESLVLRDAEFLAYLAVPKLRHLTTNAMCFYSSDGLALHASTATELTLWGQIDPDTVEDLRLLQCIQTLRFCVPPPVGMWFDHTGTHNYAIYRDFFSTISQEDKMWPELTRLYLDAPEQGLASFYTAELLAFVEHRNGRSLSNESKGTAKLIEVRIGKTVHGYTAELQEQLAALVSCV